MSDLKFDAEILEAAPSLASILAKKLRAEIEHKRLRVGERFPTDAEISKAFGVSRTVVREAVSTLREAGLISTQRGRGSIVIARVPSPSFSVSADELEASGRLMQIYEFRAVIESEGVALAAQRRTEEDLEKIAACLAEADAVDCFERAMETDIAFHLCLADAAKNEYFHRMLAAIQSAAVARRLLREDLDEASFLRLFHEVIQPEHRQIEQAIIDGDAAAAKRLLKRHLAGRRYKNLVQRLKGNAPD